MKRGEVLVVEGLDIITMFEGPSFLASEGAHAKPPAREVVVQHRYADYQLLQVPAGHHHVLVIHPLLEHLSDSPQLRQPQKPQHAQQPQHAEAFAKPRSKAISIHEVA
jgi:hypothetical protein